MSRAPVVHKKVQLPVAKPRNPVQRALLGKSLAVGVGKHQKTPGGQRLAQKQLLRDEVKKNLP